MKTKHTPGPWTVSGNSINARGGVVAEVNTIYETGEADAKLIAAAPAMFEALQAVDKLTGNCPIMSLEVQAGFQRNKAMDDYRAEVAGVILAIREQARATLKPISSGVLA